MNTEIHLHDLVALIEDVPTKHFTSDQRLLLRRGQIGTVVMAYGGDAFEVEFADAGGRTYALLPIPARQLMRLRDGPELAAA